MRSSPLAQARLYALYGKTLCAARTFATAERFVEIVPSFEGVPAGNDGEREVKVTSDPNDIWVLPSSYTLSKQIASSYLSRVYCIGPCYRQECNTSTHLNAFYQLEFEVADFNLQEIISVLRRLVNHIIKSTFGLRSHTHDLARLSWHSIDFATTHSGVRTQMAYEDYCNTVLRKTGSQFLVVAHPPASLQPANRRFHRSWADGFELLMPFGLGELASGGVRNRQYTLAHVKCWSPSVNAHLRTNSAGFGLGLERLIALLSDNPDIRRAILPHARRGFRTQAEVQT